MLTNTGQFVVEKSSAIMAHPSERSSFLDADHHNVCKYQSRQDPNYKTVLNAIKSMVEKFTLESLCFFARQDCGQDIRW